MPDGTLSPKPDSLLRLAVAVFLALLGLPADAAAQTDDDWNGRRALDLVRQARDLRQATAVDTAFQAYQADARGYVYFFLDRPDSEERTLVKTDQLALEIFWKAPRQTKQRIVGLRDEKRLPTNIRYHLDHLTVVQDDFGDLIRLGDGDEVAAVLHPVAPGAERVYDYRLADSLTLSLPAPTPDIRVYEIEIRPKDPTSPGVIGSVFLQRGTGAIVRMTFTFTPASYVDGNLDYIRISMDNSVWDGKYWLPYRQQVELRRELPLIEFLAGSVIRARFEIRNYRFNPELPPFLFTGRPVTTLPQAVRENFPFETGLYDQLSAEGLGASPELDAIREQAMAVVGRRYVSGLSSRRLYVPSVSSAYRYNRAEGSFVGAGAAFRLSPSWKLRSHGGYAFEREKGQLTLDLGHTPSTRGLGLRIWWNELNDLSGRLAGASRTVNTLAGLFGNEDYSDPFFTSGAELRYRLPVGAAGSLGITGSWERHRSGQNVLNEVAVSSDNRRPVLPVDEGDGWAVGLSYRTRLAVRGLTTEATTRLGELDDQAYWTLWWDTRFSRALTSTGGTLEARLEVGAVAEASPLQSMFLLGGRHTLPGYDYRRFIGTRVALLRIEGSRPVLAPWLALRAFAATGVTGFESNDPPQGWPVRDSDGLLTSVGLGLGVGWDLLHFDVGRGLNDGGQWEFIVSVQRRFWEWL